RNALTVVVVVEEVVSGASISSLSGSRVRDWGSQGRGSRRGSTCQGRLCAERPSPGGWQHRVPSATLTFSHPPGTNDAAGNGHSRRQPGFAQAFKEVLQVGVLFEGQPFPPGRDGEVRSRFEREGRKFPRLLHLTELGVAGRDIGRVERGSPCDPAVGFQ